MNVANIIRILRKEYPKYRSPSSAGWYKEPYLVLISCIISLRTKDEVTTAAAKRLFKLAKTPKRMLKIPLSKIRNAIYPVGFYKTKARRIKEISKKLIEEYGGVVPYRVDDLLKFKGVGRKTANIVASYGYGIPAIAVDVHVNRLVNRFGWVKTKTPEETEFALMKLLPVKYWIVVNKLLVVWGQNVCKPVNPDCFNCKVYKYCKKVGVPKKYWKSS
ncbi:endonuclease III [Candidatus Woesearchaeota archaeon]|nr:MAG: endonuclease III [Candidatus Woesearchaeota archaeon]